jgi:hypothetical protein
VDATEEVIKQIEIEVKKLPKEEFVYDYYILFF